MKIKRITFLKSIKLLLIASLMFFLACEEDIVIPPECNSGSIDFSYADSIAGTYAGSLHLRNPYEIIDTFIYVNVYDFRTETECIFYIDYFDKYVYVRSNLSFFADNWDFYGENGWLGSEQYLYLRQASFSNNKLKVEEEFSTPIGGFVTRILNVHKINKNFNEEAYKN